MKRILSAVLSLFNIMVKECAWCPHRRIIGFKRGGKGITSGICEKCRRQVMAKWKEGRNENV